ncbi:MAG: type II toxin-antitoxin system Phd/YefM family antitoxin [Geobacter sp.]|nr:type II toxin-antitoxin system Phd/YefM family antitoxin [Geobacter sp.]
MGRLRPKEDIRPLSEFRANAAAIVEQAHRTRRPIIITQRGKSTAILLDVEEYERLVNRLELLEEKALQ